MLRRTGILALALVLVLCAPSAAQELQPPFAGSYSVSDIGSPPGVPASLGGLTLKAGTTDVLLIGGAANGSAGALYEIGLVRDGAGHVTGFSGTATRFADAAYNDGGVVYGPGGVLFLARWPVNELGQTKPGSTTTDKIVPLTPLGVASSLAALQFVPAGQPGAGSLKLASYGGGQWYDADVVPDGNGTYDLTGVTAVPEATLAGGPEGFVYVPAGSPQFGVSSLLVSEYGADQVAAYDVDGNGDPVVASRRTFLAGLDGAEGALLDPLTGDFLFSTFGGGSRVVVVRGFAPPAAGTLTAITRVVNDHGGSAAPGDFSIHVRRDGGDVTGSPQPGSSSGTSYALAPGATYVVSADARAGYTVTAAGDCSVLLGEGERRTCTLTADDIAPPPESPPPEGPPELLPPELPPPMPGEAVNALPAKGTVKIRLPGTSRFVELEAGEQLPVGTTVDTRKGRVTLVAAANRSGGTATAAFYDGVFRIGQSTGSKPITTLTLVEKLRCARRGKASAAAKRKRKRRLWGNGGGRFRTRGAFSSATVRGTRWLVEDRCESTLTRVKRGRVAVRDFVKGKTVVVRAGRKYVAKRRR